MSQREMTVSIPAIDGVDVAAFFDDRASRYDDTYDLQGWGGYVLRTRMQAVLDLIGDGPGDALDAGMGPGRLCEQLALRHWTISGVDLSAEMVRSAQARLPASRGRLLQGAVEELPFADASFDAAAATGVLEYAESVHDALSELARVLRPGGRVVISVPRRSMHAFSRAITDPMARLAKRALFGQAATVVQRDPLPSAEALGRILVDLGLVVEAARHVAVLAIPAPLDDLVPAASQRLAGCLEHRRRLRGILATQLIISAKKTSELGGFDV